MTLPDIKVTPDYDMDTDEFVGWNGYLFHIDRYWICVTDNCKTPGTAASKALKYFMKVYESDDQEEKNLFGV